MKKLGSINFVTSVLDNDYVNSCYSYKVLYYIFVNSVKDMYSIIKLFFESSFPDDYSSNICLNFFFNKSISKEEILLNPDYGKFRKRFKDKDVLLFSINKDSSHYNFNNDIYYYSKYNGLIRVFYICEESRWNYKIIKEREISEGFTDTLSRDSKFYNFMDLLDLLDLLL